MASNPESLSKQDYLKLFEELAPLHRFMGFKVIEFQKDAVQILVPFKEEFIGNFVNRFWHGGMIAAAIDAVGGLAAASHFYPEISAGRLSTIDLRIDYLKPVKDTGIIAKGYVARAGNKTMLIKMEVLQEEGNEILAEGKGTWNIR